MKQVQRQRLKKKTISQSEWRECVKRGRAASQPSMSAFRVFILLSCSCCCIVEILRTYKDSAELSTVYGWNSMVK